VQRTEMLQKPPNGQPINEAAAAAAAAARLGPPPDSIAIGVRRPSGGRVMVTLPPRMSQRGPGCVGQRHARDVIEMERCNAERRVMCHKACQPTHAAPNFDYRAHGESRVAREAAATSPHFFELSIKSGPALKKDRWESRMSDDDGPAVGPLDGPLVSLLGAAVRDATARAAYLLRTNDAQSYSLLSSVLPAGEAPATTPLPRQVASPGTPQSRDPGPAARPRLDAAPDAAARAGAAGAAAAALSSLPLSLASSPGAPPARRALEAFLRSRVAYLEEETTRLQAVCDEVRRIYHRSGAWQYRGI
jgi:hypothetical protein